MRRRRLERKLQAYLDGALSASECRRLERVIERDAEARRSLERNRALGTALRAAWTDGPPAPPADALLRAIRPELAAIDRELTRRPSLEAALGQLGNLLRPLRLPVLAGTTAAVAVLMLVAIPRGGDTPPQPPAPPQAERPFAEPPPAPANAPVAVAAADTIYELDQGEGSVTILEGGEGATIIWVVEDEDELSRLDASAEGWA